MATARQRHLPMRRRFNQVMPVAQAMNQTGLFKQQVLTSRDLLMWCVTEVLVNPFVTQQAGW